MKRFVLTFILILCAVMLFSCQNDITDESKGDTEAASSSETQVSEIIKQASPDFDGEHPALIAHGGGAVYGYRLTNSLEALDTAYSNGFRVFELDFEVTSDGKYVLLHDWESMAGRMLLGEEQITLDEFKGAEKFASLTLLDLDGLFEWLLGHEDCYIVTDGKCGNEPFLAELYKSAGELSGKFIPQAYSYDEYEMAKSIGFERVILTLYGMNDTEEGLFSFAESQKPWAITIPAAVLTPTLVSHLAELGIYTYAHTVNDLSFYEEWREYGLYGIYTDYFCPVNWVY